jgi:hypothetical protein
VLKQLLVGGLVLAALSSPAAAGWVWVPNKAPTVCAVADPTGTPLNVRSSPKNGTVLGALHNDTLVTVKETATVGSQKWVRVAHGRQAGMGLLRLFGLRERRRLKCATSS